MDLSVIIVSYNTCALLRQCISSVLAADPPPAGVEVIVVDNGSDDGSVEMVREQFPQIGLVVNEQNLGYAAANNRGAAVAKGRFLLYLNSDTLLNKDAIRRPLEYLSNNPDVGALTVRLVYPSGERDPDNHRGFPTPWNAFCHFTALNRIFPGSERFNGYFQSYKDFDATHDVDVIAGSYMMMPQAIDRELGGWDETYFFYGEDIDYCYRLGEAGYRIVYYPLVEVLHYKGASSGLRKESAAMAAPSRETRILLAQESVRAMELFYEKFYSDLYPRPVTAVILAGIRFRGWFRVMKHRLS